MTAAVDIGTTMRLHCDAVVAALDANCLAPFGGLGLLSETGSSQLLPERIGHARALAMFALGASRSGVAAVTHGVGSFTALSAQVHAKAREMALVLAKKYPAFLRATQCWVRVRVQITKVIDKEFSEFEKQLVSPEAKEAFTAFGKKRAPDDSQFE